MKPRNIFIIACGFSICVFLIFIVAHGYYVHNKENRRVANHSRIIAGSMWDYDVEDLNEYFQVASGAYNYKNIVITHSTGEVFFVYDRSFQKPVDRLFISLTLIKPHFIASDVVYNDKVVGRITVNWYNDAVYTYLYAFLLVFLGLWALWFFLRNVESNRNLEIKVLERTKELQQITEDLKQSNELLRTSEKTIQQMAVAGNIGLWDWDLSTGQVYFSSQWKKQLGYEDHEIEGRYEEWERRLHPDDLDKTLSALKASHASPWPPYEVEFRLRHKDGSYRWILAKGALEFDDKNQPVHMMGSHVDITDRKLAENAVVREMTFSDEIINLLPGIFYMYDAQGKLKRWNKKHEEISGYSSEELLDMYILDWFSEGYKQYIMSHVQKVFAEGSSDAEAPLRIKDGREIPHIFTGGLAVLDGQQYLIGLGVNITEKKKLEEQLLQAQKMECIGHFAGGIAHDFNNILTTIVGYGYLVRRKMANDDPQRLDIEHMLEGANRAASLARDLLLFSRKQISERKPVDMNNVIRTVEKFLKRVIGEDIECRTALFEGKLPVLGDTHQLEQVLMNFATNSRDAMPDGGVFTISTEQVRLNDVIISAFGHGKLGEYVLLSISDTGKGMDAATKQHIFEPMFTTKEEGTGLGLAVVYGIITQHEGFIKVYSEPGQGTTFKIYLPLIASGPEEEKKTEDESPAGGTETILYSEDDKPVREVTKRLLEDFGYKVIAAHDGQDAVIKFRENRDNIQLLLFDVIMPGKTGEKAYDEIKAIRPDIKVLFLSGHPPDLVRKSVPLENNINIISKATSPTELLKTVRSILDGK